MFKFAIPAAAAAFLLCSGASAAPLATPSGLKAAQTSDVIEVRERRRSHRHHRRAHRHYSHRHHHHSGRHYRHAPRGYRRYYSRPYDWRDRGCITIGPVWWCA